MFFEDLVHMYGTFKEYVQTHKADNLTFDI